MFNVFYQNKGQSEWKLLLCDLTKGEVRRDFVKPYKSGKILVSSKGTRISANEISDFKIVSMGEEYLSRIQTLTSVEQDEWEDHNGFMFPITTNNADIIREGKEVTDSFLKKDTIAGTGTTFSRIWSKCKWLLLVVLTAAIGCLVAKFLEIQMKQ